MAVLSRMIVFGVAVPGLGYDTQVFTNAPKASNEKIVTDYIRELNAKALEDVQKQEKEEEKVDMKKSAGTAPPPPPPPPAFFLGNAKKSEKIETKKNATPKYESVLNEGDWQDWEELKQLTKAIENKSIDYSTAQKEVRSFWQQKLSLAKEPGACLVPWHETEIHIWNLYQEKKELSCSCDSLAESTSVHAMELRQLLELDEKQKIPVKMGNDKRLRINDELPTFQMTKGQLRRHRVRFSNEKTNKGFKTVLQLPQDTMEYVLPDYNWEKEKRVRLIFAMDFNGEVYARNEVHNFKKKFLNNHNFHHSSFLRSTPVLCAGEIILKKAKLLGKNVLFVDSVSNKSGHYRPNHESFRTFLELFLKRDTLDASTFKAGYSGTCIKQSAEKFISDFDRCL